jgi:uracil-DNA glycosylase family 4
VVARKACRACAASGLVNGSVWADGTFDSPHMGPWTGSLGDLHARVIVVGQDWGDARAFEKQRGRDFPTSATNRMLRELMTSAGIGVPQIEPAHNAGVFLTNAVLCFRTADGCQGPVQDSWFTNCGTRFLKAQIDLIKPEVVVGMGARAYGAVLSAYGVPPVKNWRTTVEGPGLVLPTGSTAFAVYHCGRRILNTHRDREAQLEDWKRIGDTMRLRKPSGTALTAPDGL